MKTPASIRVLTVDRLPLVHAGVCQLLNPFTDIEVMGVAFTLADLLCQKLDCTRATVLIEIDDLGPDWEMALQHLVRAMPTSQIVVFTMAASPERVRRALRAGVHGYLLKQVQPLALAQALRSIAVGQRVLDPEATAAMLRFHSGEAPLITTLSQREREVLTLLAAGLSNQAIATHLFLSRATVKFHCGNIFAKLGVDTRSHAVAVAFAHNMVPRPMADDEQWRSRREVHSAPITRWT